MADYTRRIIQTTNVVWELRLPTNFGEVSKLLVAIDRAMPELQEDEVTVTADIDLLTFTLDDGPSRRLLARLEMES